jgi:hypothetical protein
MLDVNRFLELKRELEVINAKKQELVTRDLLLREQVATELSALGVGSLEELKVEIDKAERELESTAVEAEAYLVRSREELRGING